MLHFLDPVKEAMNLRQQIQQMMRKEEEEESRHAVVENFVASERQKLGQGPNDFITFDGMIQGLQDLLRIALGYPCSRKVIEGWRLDLNVVTGLAILAAILSVLLAIATRVYVCWMGSPTCK